MRCKFDSERARPRAGRGPYLYMQRTQSCPLDVLNLLLITAFGDIMDAVAVCTLPTKEELGVAMQLSECCSEFYEHEVCALPMRLLMCT